MRELKEIIEARAITVDKQSVDGIAGTIRMIMWTGTFICSWGGGWEHVSVKPFTSGITPSWRDMCKIKDIFFRGDEAVIQIHPPMDEYVNNVPNCLHLWRATDQIMVLPPSFMVGMRKGQTYMDVIREAKAYYKARGEEWND